MAKVPDRRADDEEVANLKRLLEQLADLTVKLSKLVVELAKLVHS